MDVHTQRGLTIAGLPIVLWRTATEIKAFANMCRAPLMWNGESQVGTLLRCHYHGWTYDESGTLIFNTDFGAPCPSLQLHCLQVWTQSGWICILESTSEYPCRYISHCAYEYIENAGVDGNIDTTTHIEMQLEDLRKELS